MSVAGLSVRPLREADAPGWHALMRERAETVPDAFLLSPGEVRAMTPEEVRANVTRGHLHGLFLPDGTLAGFGALHPGGVERVRHRAAIGPFYVSADLRGTGAGEALMRGLVAAARRAGIDWLDLWVAADNLRARAFYRRMGFAEVCTRPDAVRIGGVPFADVLMVGAVEAMSS